MLQSSVTALVTFNAEALLKSIFLSCRDVLHGVRRRPDSRAFVILR